MIKNWPIELKFFFIKEINKIWNGKNIPKPYRKVQIKAILKKGKPQDDIDSYRALAMMSCALKIVNQLIKNRLSEFLEDKQIFTNNFYGFRKNKSTIECINDLLFDIRESMEKCNYVAVIF